MREKKYTIKNPYASTEINDAVLTLSEPDRARIEWPLRKTVFKSLVFLSFVVLFLFTGRFLYLNVYQGFSYQEMSYRNSIRSVIIPAPRGFILDQFGAPLVNNIPSIDLVLTPLDVPEDEQARTSLKQELATLQVPQETIEKVFAELDPRSPKQVLLKQSISQDEALIFLEKGERLPGVTLFKTTQRNYINGPIFSHVIGYEGKIYENELKENPEYHLTDTIGKQGIERSYENDLRGEYGFQQGEVDSLGRIKKDLGIIQPVPGSDVYLHIDADLQRKLTDEMLRQLEVAGIKKGAAVAIDPRNGAVRALVSIPSFDNNLFAKGIKQLEYSALTDNPDQPLFNRAIAGAYPPGSTIKPLHAVAALSERTISPEQEIESRGGIQIGNFFFGDWKAHGFTDMRRAIAVSSDVYFYSIGGGYGGVPGLGIERMKKYDSLFGYGTLSGIDIPGEVPGFLPDPAWKQKRFNERWYIGDDYNSAIGQGYITATALQVANSITPIANGGILYEPKIARSVKEVDGTVRKIEPKVIRSNFVDPNILQVVREGMRETVTEGTAQLLQTAPVPVAGKTGTAQFGTQEKTQGWFVSYAPYDTAPEIVLAILFEGQEAALTYNGVPVTKSVYDWYFSPEQREKRRAQ